jgi:hypothetical protein
MAEYLSLVVDTFCLFCYYLTRYDLSFRQGFLPFKLEGRGRKPRFGGVFK